jgi:hypothetical protein
LFLDPTSKKLSSRIMVGLPSFGRFRYIDIFNTLALNPHTDVLNFELLCARYKQVALRLFDDKLGGHEPPVRTDFNLLRELVNLLREREPLEQAEIIAEINENGAANWTSTWSIYDSTGTWTSIHATPRRLATPPPQSSPGTPQPRHATERGWRPYAPRTPSSAQSRFDLRGHPASSTSSKKRPANSTCDTDESSWTSTFCSPKRPRPAAPGGRDGSTPSTSIPVEDDNDDNSPNEPPNAPQPLYAHHEYNRIGVTPTNFRYTMTNADLLTWAARQGLDSYRIPIGVVRRPARVCDDVFAEYVVTAALPSSTANEVVYRVHAADIRNNSLSTWDPTNVFNINITRDEIDALGYYFAQFQHFTKGALRAFLLAMHSTESGQWPEDW